MTTRTQRYVDHVDYGTPDIQEDKHLVWVLETGPSGAVEEHLEWDQHSDLEEYNQRSYMVLRNADHEVVARSEERGILDRSDIIEVWYAAAPGLVSAGARREHAMRSIGA